MDAKDLKVFEAVARCEGMKRAALELNTVQSNITARIRQLETSLGVMLFERRRNGMKLTPAGSRLLPYAFEVRSALANAERAVSDVGAPAGPMFIGARKTTSTLHLTNILSSYAITFPEVDVRIRTETSPLLQDLVLERKLEGAFVCDPVEHHDLLSELVFDEELVIFTAPHISDLDSLPKDTTKMIVLGQGSFYQTQLEQVLEQLGFSTKKIMELGTLENILGCVSCGLGITLLPRVVLKSSIYRDAVRPHNVKVGDCRVKTLFIRRRDSFVSSALSAFMECSRIYAQKAQPFKFT